MKSRAIVGVDGCKGGWVAAIKRGATFKCFRYLDFSSLINEAQGAIVLVDIPIGLAQKTGERTIENEMRKVLKHSEHPRYYSVFNAPCRQAFTSLSNGYWATSLHNKQVLGKGLSQQSYHIIPKIQEVDEWLLDNLSFRSIIHESHPEVAFAFLNASESKPVPMKYNKKKSIGMTERLTVLRQYENETGVEIDSCYSEAVQLKGVAKDDIIDAMCLCMVGILGERHELSFLQQFPEKDATGIPIQIAFYMAKG